MHGARLASMCAGSCRSLAHATDHSEGASVPSLWTLPGPQCPSCTSICTPCKHINQSGRFALMTREVTSSILVGDTNQRRFTSRSLWCSWLSHSLHNLKRPFVAAHVLCPIHPDVVKKRGRPPHHARQQQQRLPRQTWNARHTA